jgi:hypothetical protein
MEVGMNKAKLITLLATVCFSVSGAYASTVYSYAGSAFTDRTGVLGDSFQEVTISLTFAEALGPSHLYSQTPSGTVGGTLLDWRLKDGLFDLGPSFFGGSLDNCTLFTDASGNILMWLIDAHVIGSDGSLVHDISTPYVDQAGLYGTAGQSSTASNANLPGTWSSDTLVPEPGSFALLLVALTAGFAWRRKRARE